MSTKSDHLWTASRLICIVIAGLIQRVLMSLAVVGTAVFAVVVSLAMLGFGKQQWDPRGKVSPSLLKDVV